MLLALITDTIVTAPQHDLVESLQLLVLPVVLVAVPILLKRNKRNTANTNAMAEQVGTTNGSGTLANMAEKTLIAIGALQSDISHMNDRLEAHAHKDEIYAATTDKRLERIEKAVKS